MLAQLATVDDTALSQILAAQYRSLLPVLVVQTNACTQRMTQALAQAQLPMPDVLSLSHSQPYRQVSEQLRHISIVVRHALCVMPADGADQCMHATHHLSAGSSSTA